MWQPDDEPSSKKRNDEHFAWACKYWVRMDRDGDGFLTRPELDSEEFRNAIRSALGVKKHEAAGGRDYSRFKINVDQAIDWVRRKADQNHDSSLAFKEFESFTRKLRSGDAESNADMIFALFDVGGNDTLEKEEFREIYRYFLGRVPTRIEFEEEWGRLDWEGMQQVTKADYVKWLQTSHNPVFRRHATIVPTDIPETQMDFAKNFSKKSVAPIKEEPKGAAGFKTRKKPLFESKEDHKWARRIQTDQDRRYGGGFAEKGDRPEWNKRHHLGSWENIGKPRGQRTYFSRPQSMPELQRFYSTRPGYGSHLKRLQSPERKVKQMVLSGEGNAPMDEGRHEPGGTMKSTEGLTTFWNNFWQPTATEMWRYTPGTNTLRLPGAPVNMYQDD